MQTKLYKIDPEIIVWNERKMGLIVNLNGIKQNRLKSIIVKIKENEYIIRHVIK